ncbi:hypothetical protein Hanom_Chr15g01381441 [Helianthus anomalus]
MDGDGGWWTVVGGGRWWVVDSGGWLWCLTLCRPYKILEVTGLSLHQEELE